MYSVAQAWGMSEGVSAAEPEAGQLTSWHPR